jgi:hypothetical protein
LRDGRRAGGANAEADGRARLTAGTSEQPRRRRDTSAVLGEVRALKAKSAATAPLPPPNPRGGSLAACGHADLASGRAGLAARAREGGDPRAVASECRAGATTAREDAARARAGASPPRSATPRAAVATAAVRPKQEHVSKKEAERSALSRFWRQPGIGPGQPIKAILWSM